MLDRSKIFSSFRQKSSNLLPSCIQYGFGELETQQSLTGSRVNLASLLHQGIEPN